MSLYLKYRPDTLEQVKGNAETIEALEKMLSDLDECPHVFLFHGPTGCGKTTLARIIATRLGCVGSDFNELDIADLRGIDNVRDIRNSSYYRPMEGPVRVWLLDEIQKMTGDAQNAMLKILEDTPKHVYFILCTTDPQKLISTIRGRCQQFQVKLLTEQQMLGLLRNVCRKEEQTVEREILEHIVRSAEGHPRNALNILEQVIAVSPENRLEVAQKQAEQQAQMIDLCRALLNHEGWKKVSGILTGIKDQDPETIRRVVLGYCQSVLLGGDKEIAGLIMELFMEPTYNSGFPQIVFNCYSITKNK